jgi:hypothetical protein
MKVVALFTKFQGHTATEMMVRIKQPRLILIHLGHNAAMSMPVEIPLRTMQRESCDTRNASPEKKVPALAAGVIGVDWINSRSSKGFQK